MRPRPAGESNREPGIGTPSPTAASWATPPDSGIARRGRRKNEQFLRWRQYSGNRLRKLLRPYAETRGNAASSAPRYAPRQSRAREGQHVTAPPRATVIRRVFALGANG